jgi:plasmid stabilization system protein ParE
MKIELLESFLSKLNDQVKYISKDKPQAARKFKNDLLKKIDSLNKFPFPFQCRRSVYFENSNIRDLIFKGYTIVYRVDKKKEAISVFALINTKRISHEKLS